ncbi:GH1 family beta-glucosidase [Alteromonas lipolytica]|uniref:Beta-glucosidase n=1 Tax=Alteromonas lipolytica TaxID=1856405 RepID=A0A1E8FCC5_9ALTE|nr:GH1 family beta-glucosidase [Alteromonas lipolytica]OFI33153.1 beta-glucosidase [Alteromonas lipolytica]GGF62030.1 beta-glucosidase [Alteromonas lipolytica]
MTKFFSFNSVLSQPDFVMGVATSSFQIEGGSEHREPCIWDTFCRVPGAIKDGSNGMQACNHYDLWQQDIALIDELGFDAYRFSVCWPRIIRADGSINESGLAFYLQILDELERRGLKAYVTLYHWELPQYLEDKGGWLNRHTAYAFADYAGVVARAFGNKVSAYTTLNEPYCSAFLGYEIGIHAPGKIGKQYGKKAAHHLLLAHGLAMQVLREVCPDIPSGLVLNFTTYYPASKSTEDSQAALKAKAHFSDWYIKPALTGQYPALLENLPDAEKPLIAPGDMAIIATPMDYLGVNYYTRALVRAQPGGHFEILPPAPDVEITAMNWEIYPEGLYDLLLQLNQEYDLPPLFITENGMASDDVVQQGQIKDVVRADYLQSHLEAVANAINKGVEIKGYFVWSLLDNFEWAEGYLKRFGIVYVDFATQQRVPKQSALMLQDWLTQRHKPL